jgi:hypothetical protein
MGAAIANASAIVVVNVARVAQLQSRLHINPFSWSLAKPAAAVAVALLLTIPIRAGAASIGTAGLALLWTAMVLAYGGTLYVLGLDHHSRLAWNHLRGSLVKRFRPSPLSLPLGKEAQ